MEGNAVFSTIIPGHSIDLIALNLELHIPILFRLSNGSPINLNNVSVPEYDPDEVIWKYMLNFKFNSEQEMINFYRTLSNLPDCLLYAINDKALNMPVGIVAYKFINFQHMTIEIGYIWVSPAVMRTGKSIEATYLLLKKAFDKGFRSVVWRCFRINEGSKILADKIGLRCEIIAESMVIKGEFAADNSLYSINLEEWKNYKESGRYQRFENDKKD